MVDEMSKPNEDHDILEDVQEVVIGDRYDTISVPVVDRFGIFVVHRTVSRSKRTGRIFAEEGHSVTHAPSGCALVGGMERSRAAGLAWRLGEEMEGAEPDESLPSRENFAAMFRIVSGLDLDPEPETYDDFRRAYEGQGDEEEPEEGWTLFDAKKRSRKLTPRG